MSPLPGNGIFVVKGEMAIVMTAMRRGVRWSSHSHQDDELDALMRSFYDLKETINRIDDLWTIDAKVYLNPFLEIIKSEETTGPVTSLALSAINKFLSYGLIDPRQSCIPEIVDNIADAVTHARFVGTDQASDGVVLMKILQVLRTLTLAPEGAILTNDALCEIMLSCFRICFETRLNELLRRTAEHYLKDMVQLVFIRLPQFAEDPRMAGALIKQLIKMKHGYIEQSRTKRRKRTSLMGSKTNQLESGVEMGDNTNVKGTLEGQSTPSLVPKTTLTSGLRLGHPLATTPLTPDGNIVDMQGSISQPTHQSPNLSDTDFNSPCYTESGNLVDAPTIAIHIQSPDSVARSDVDNDNNCTDDQSLPPQENVDQPQIVEEPLNEHQLKCEEYVNPRGIRFTAQSDDSIGLIPYGLPSVREMFRFLISLCNSGDKQNTDAMIHLGLNLLIVAFEVGADNIGKYGSLLALVKDDLCRNLFSLLNSERISVFAADLQLSFLMFESLRNHLKFQLEYYLTKLIEMITSDSLKITYEHKELALETIVQLWRIPGFVTELYLNYDCNMYCGNLYEDVTKLLAKNAFPATTGLYHTHLLALDALLAVIETLETHAKQRIKAKLDATDPHQGSPLRSGANDSGDDDDGGGARNPVVASRQKVSAHIPTRDDLLNLKNIKRWLPTGTEYFNHKPKKGIQFLQEHGILTLPTDADEIVHFLRDNPNLDKAMIGEYICARTNLSVLEAFVRMFDFAGMRVDEALRQYLETFRLPGEAPQIALLLEHFAEHWHKCNGEPFANADAAFTLAYAIIMLNVDQHNHNVKKQSVPMTVDEFKKNLKKVNGGSDFDDAMLNEIYNAIRGEEIVMPAEQTGIVRENYLWKVLLRRGVSKDGAYTHVADDRFDCDLFALIWTPIVAALSFVYDKSDEARIYRRAMKGFESCAFVASYFNATQQLDMLLLTICKFSTFHGAAKTSNAIQFGSNPKAQLALKTVLHLSTQLHGSNIREGWKHIFDLFLALYNSKLLPKSLMVTEDFAAPNGQIELIYEIAQLQKPDTGLFSSLYSYVVSSENLTKLSSSEEQQLLEMAQTCINDCHLDAVITESKFISEESLLELIKALLELSRGPDVQKSLGYNYNENVAVFFLELLIRIVIQNKDRVLCIWQIVRDHLYTLVMNASYCDYQYLLERSVTGLLRLAIRLMRNEDMSPIVLQSLRMLLLLKNATLYRIARQISYGLYELLKTSAQNIHTSTDWSIIFTLLECVGAGAHPPKPVLNDHQHQDAKSEGEETAVSNSEDEGINVERGYTSDSELTRTPRKASSIRPQSPIILASTTPTTTTTAAAATAPLPVQTSTSGWILVGNEGEVQHVIGRTLPAEQYSLALEGNLGPNDAAALVKCCESLAFLVRDVAHITPYNFDNCVHCIRTFVEASLNGGRRARTRDNKQYRRSDVNKRREQQRRRAQQHHTMRKSAQNYSSPDVESDDDDDEDLLLPNGYHQISIQLLDLMHTLHTRTAQIFRWWAEESGEIAQEISLWTQGWCPLLQGIARLCCDNRKQIRMSAITYLQRALLVHDLQTLSGPEWEACFQRVLFPLLTLLLTQPLGPKETPQVMEETRMRAATVLSKVFLHHLTPLLTLPTFTSLWLTILDFMDKYMHADNSDLLSEAIPESLKNMLLVMDSANVFEEVNGQRVLWSVTWERINLFLPNLKSELFKEEISRRSLDDEERPVDETKMQTPSATAHASASPTQHNIENATRSSIILQPLLAAESSIASPLFAHLGQMVSTPIGAPISSTYYKRESERIQTPSSPKQQLNSNLITSIDQLPLQLMPSETVVKSNNNQQAAHTFPILNNTTAAPSTTILSDLYHHQQQQEQQPSSLYSEYIENPYNNSVEQLVNPDIETAPVDDEENINLQQQQQVPQPMNFFNSSNYFTISTSTTENIPPGSEILYASPQFNIPNMEVCSKNH